MTETGAGEAGRTTAGPATPAPGAEGVYLGLDLGTSGLKGVALAASGAVLARGSAAYPMRRPAAGACEQDPAAWLRATESVTDQISSVVPASRWRGIGLSGMIPTLVTIGADAQPAGPAVIWQDSRADALGEELRETCGGDWLYRLTGQWVDGRYLLPMFSQLAVREPARAAATVALASAKDYLFSWLTGELVTDPSTATGFGCYELASGRWNDRVRSAAAALTPSEAGARGGSPGQLPPGQLPPGQVAPGQVAPGHVAPALPAVRPSAYCRPLRPAVAERLGCGPIPVCLGAADSVLGALGLGVREPGQIAYIAGTSNVILGVTSDLVLDPEHRFLVTPLAEPGRFGAEMDLLATGSSISWLADLLGGGLDAAGLVALAARTDPAAAPVVLPFLSPGEQGALWDPRLHGAVVGLSLAHGREHLARGLVTGIILESRRCLAVLDETGGSGRELAVAGGSASDPGFRADLADATRRRVWMPGDDDTDYSARGAALLAARAIGGSWPAQRPAELGGSGVAEPDEDRARVWDQLWATHESARRAIARHHHGH
ncbi:MAG TPA: FGGY-family carbohydrate kinase [Streptosporangiaceae bacterium]